MSSTARRSWSGITTELGDRVSGPLASGLLTRAAYPSPLSEPSQAATRRAPGYPRAGALRRARPAPPPDRGARHLRAGGRHLPGHRHRAVQRPGVRPGGDPGARQGRDHAGDRHDGVHRPPQGDLPAPAGRRPGPRGAALHARSPPPAWCAAWRRSGWSAAGWTTRVRSGSTRPTWSASRSAAWCATWRTGTSSGAMSPTTDATDPTDPPATATPAAGAAGSAR